MEVIPISVLDSNSTFRNMRVHTFFILDDRLDETKLRDALTRLIRDHWRKLGARIVTQKNKRPVYHLPKVFADDYELFRWSADHSDSSIDEAAAEMHLKTAKPEGGVAVLPSLTVCDALFRPQHWPITFDAEPDAPMLLVHLSIFADATVMTISHAHILGDQLGLANIIKAWLGLLEDKLPPPLVGYSEDILPGQKPFTQYPKSETFKKGRHHVRRPFERARVLLPFIWEMMVERKEETATIFFPLPLVQSIRKRQTATLTDKYGADPELTNADIISAIMAKVRPQFLPNVPSPTVCVNRQNPRSSPASPRKRKLPSPSPRPSTSAAASPPSPPRSPKQATSTTVSSTQPRASPTSTRCPSPR
jgi:hypothetical protein